MSGCHKVNPTEDRTTLHPLPFHDPELLRKWLGKIDLKSDPTTVSRVCSLHFDDDSFYCDGLRRMLHPSSVPLEFKVCLNFHQTFLLFFNLLLYQVNGQKILNYSSCHDIKTEVQEVEPLLFVDSLYISDDDKICGFEGFTERLSSSKVPWKLNWNVFEQPGGVCLYKLKSDEEFKNVTLSFKIIITSELLVSIYQNENEADIKELDWLLKSSKLELWSQFYKLTDYYQTEPTVQMSTGSSVVFVKQALKYLNRVESSEVIGELTEPIRQQLTMVVNGLGTINSEIDEKNFFESNLYPEVKYSVEFNEGRSALPYGLDYEKEEEEDESYRFAKPASRRTADTQSSRSFKSPLKIGSSSDILKCPHCEKFFLSMRKLRSHLQSHVRVFVVDWVVAC